MHDGSPDSAAALRLGALDAARTGSDVHVVVLPPAAPGGGTTAVGLLLDAAQEEVREAAPAAATVLPLAPGPVLPAVLAAARGARLLTVGARGPGHEWAAGWDETALALSWRAPAGGRSWSAPAARGRPARWRAPTWWSAGPTKACRWNTCCRSPRCTPWRCDWPVRC